MKNKEKVGQRWRCKEYGWNFVAALIPYYGSTLDTKIVQVIKPSFSGELGRSSGQTPILNPTWKLLKGQEKEE